MAEIPHNKQSLVALWAAIVIPVMMALGGLAWEYGSVSTRVLTLEELRTEGIAVRLADEKAFNDALREIADGSRQQATTNQELRDGVTELRKGIGELRAAIVDRRR